MEGCEVMLSNPLKDLLWKYGKGFDLDGLQRRYLKLKEKRGERISLTERVRRFRMQRERWVGKGKK